MADAYFSARFEDCFDLGSALSPEDVQVRQPIRKFVDAWVRPYAGQWWLEEKFPQDLVARLAQLGVFGPTLLEELGGPDLSPISYGLMMQEWLVKRNNARMGRNLLGGNGRGRPRYGRTFQCT